MHFESYWRSSADFKSIEIDRKPDGLPKSYGMLLFPAFESLDVFGPLDALQTLSRSYKMDLALISSTLDPVTTKPRSLSMNPENSTFFQSVVPTHTLESAPPLDVLIVPGGLGTRAPDLNSTIHWIAKTYPTLKYLITVCTGAGLAAQSGVLDGKKATTNKASWASTVKLGPKVHWVSHARWTVDGNIWTSSGISASIDVTLAFIDKVYGSNVAKELAYTMEYERHEDPSWDPFANYFNVTKVKPPSDG
jgi:transcriptional regulator GlxA family with amidase domain